MKKTYGLLICGALGFSLLAGIHQTSKKDIKPAHEEKVELTYTKKASLTPVQPSGSGSSTDPYKIGTAGELAWFRNHINSQSNANNRKKCAKLTSDIDLEGSEDNQWTPIGTSSRDYRGTFDGNGYVVSNLYINGGDLAGLFGQVKGGTIKNLTVCGDVSSTDTAGGIVGYLYTLKSGSNYTYSTMTNCVNYCNVHVDLSYNGYAGGISGNSWYPRISNCTNYGNVSAYAAAGIVPNTYDQAIIQKCANYGTIAGKRWGAGIVGVTNTGDRIENCYNVGAISNTLSKCGAGGIAGEITNGEFRYNHNYGTVTGNYKGAIVGKKNLDYGSFTANYYLSTSCSSGGAPSTSISPENYSTQSSFSGFDFNNTWIMGKNYPVLRYPFSGQGTANNPYIVDSYEALKHVQDDLTKHYKLAHDILNPDSSANVFTPIGNETTPFSGVFDGDNYRIIGIKIQNDVNGADPVGLFGTTAVDSEIKNLSLTGSVLNNDNSTNANFVGTGAFVGHAEGHIYNCHNYATVEGYYNVGGLVGRLGYNGTSYTEDTLAHVEKCSNHAAVVATTNCVGGIAGRGFGNITNSYNDGTVTISEFSTSGNDNAGGIVGYYAKPFGSVTPTIRYCHSQKLIKGNAYIGSIVGYLGSSTLSSNNYYLNNTVYSAKVGYNKSGGVGSSSGNPTNSGTTSLTNEGAVIQSNYGGWDFDDIWMMGESYPIFYNRIDIVIGLINSIGVVEATSSCLERIQTARAAYNDLTESERAHIYNYKDLTDAEVSLVEAFIDLVVLGEYSETNKTNIDNAKAAYNALPSQQKSKVNQSKVTLLTNAEKVYDAEKAIDDIPSPFVYTPEFKDAIDAARSKYNALNSDETLEALVDNYQTLLDAEAFWKSQDDPVKAQEVKDLIDAIAPIEYTTECGGEIEAARTAYDALNDEAKAIVGDQYLATLVSYEKEYDCMDKIAKIAPVTYTPACETKINTAREAYDALSEQEKAVISNYQTLVSSEKIYPVEGNIEAIGTVEYTEECKALIDAARTSFDSLSDAEQNDVDNKQKLLDAEAAYKDFDDVAKSNAVKELINDIGEVVLDNPTKEAIEAAEAAYEALSPEAKALVGEELHEILVEARATYSSLVDNASANEVIAKINAIGEVDGSDACKARIDDARSSYEELTDTQKGLVSNYETLLAAEKAYAEKTSGLAWWAVILIILASLIALAGATYLVMFYLGNKWINKDGKALRVYELGKKGEEVRLFMMNCRIEYRKPEEVFHSKEDALK